MPDRVVYLVSKLPESHSELEFVNDAQLSRLVSEGWEVSSTLPDRQVRVGGKSIKAAMMILRQAADNRGIATIPPERSQERAAGGAQVVVRDDFGRERGVSLGEAVGQTLDGIRRALATINAPSHLGAPEDANIPGLNVVSSTMVQKAYDVGMLAAARGENEAANPFPRFSVAAQKWLQGLRSYERSQAEGGQKADPVAIAEAEGAGEVTARQFGRDDVVTCPYPPSSPLRAAWLRGFQRAGGRVE